MPKPENYPPFAAHIDANQYPTSMGVVGTLGTSDTVGTAQPLPFAVNPATGASYVHILGTSVAIGGGGGGGGTITDQAAFSSGTTQGNLVMGVYQATPDTLGTQTSAAIGIDINRNTKVTEATLLAGEDLTANVMKVEQRFSYAVITTATTTTIKSAAGFLHSIIVTGGAPGTIGIFDNTAASGNSIGNFDSTAALAFFPFNVSFATGLTITTGAATKLTIAYR